MTAIPGGVGPYPSEPWWPPEAVTFHDGPCAAAAGWPFLSFSSLRTVTVNELPGDQGFDAKRVQHWGVVLLDTTKGGWDEFPAVLPFRPVWPGIAVNTLLYALLAAIAVEGGRAVRRRKRLARGLCVACGYPADGVKRCPECGERRDADVDGPRGPDEGEAPDPRDVVEQVLVEGEGAWGGRAAQASSRRSPLKTG